MPGFLSSQTTTAAGEDHLLELLDELIDAHADTVQLVIGDERSGPGWVAHCDYLRALQRLGHETLAHHDGRDPEPPRALAIVSGRTTKALARHWMAPLVVLRGLVSVVQALPPGGTPRR